MVLEKKTLNGHTWALFWERGNLFLKNGFLESGNTE